MRILPIAAALSALAACSPAAEPAPAPALSFSVEGGTYAWSLADGARPSLTLARQDGPGPAEPVLVIACGGPGTGGLQTRLFRAEPIRTPLTLTAGEAVMTVPGRPRPIGGGRTLLEGEGAPPQDWVAALGAAGTLKLRYGDQGVEVQGPAPEPAAAFGRACRTLEPGRG
jgi:hypothetical protein